MRLLPLIPVKCAASASIAQLQQHGAGVVSPPVWFGRVWYGIVWYGLVRCGAVSCGLVWKTRPSGLISARWAAF